MTLSYGDSGDTGFLYICDEEDTCEEEDPCLKVLIAVIPVSSTDRERVYNVHFFMNHGWFRFVLAVIPVSSIEGSSGKTLTSPPMLSIRSLSCQKRPSVRGDTVSKETCRP